MSDPYSSGTTGKCPHCQFSVCFDNATPIIERGPNWANPSPTYLAIEGEQERIFVYSSSCPNCNKQIVISKITIAEKTQHRLVHPFNIVRTVPLEVPKVIAVDFLEAAEVLSISEKASAALSRRCLQNLLTNRGFTKRDLNDQIGDAIPTLPTVIGENLDAVRNIGNFAAHPLKYTSSGQIVDVEPEEAEWNLEVLESLFDYFYVQPVKAKEKRDKLNTKLAALHKPPMKT
jgi:hypothetical protein